MNVKRLLAILLSILSGTAAMPVCTAAQPKVFRPEVQLFRSEDMTPENGLNHPDWQKVPAYQFKSYVTETDHIGRVPDEKAYVQYLYNNRYLFVRVHMQDSDIITAATGDQDHFYIMGDLVEVFIKPLNDSYYWEIYGTPNKLFTRFYYPSRGTLGLPSGFGPTDIKIPVDASVDGTFNDSSDVDKGWVSLICIPRSELEKNGLKFEKGNQWTIFTSRYNYGVHLPAAELSSFPQIRQSYHTLPYYALVKFED